MAKLNLNSNSRSSLKVGKKVTLNRWLIFDGIALIIVVGVLAARFSHAGVNYSFMRTPAQMSGGTLGRSITSGDYRHLAANGVHAEASAKVTADEMAASTQVCAQMHVNSAKTFVDIQINGLYANKFVESAGDVTVCADTNKQAQGGDIFAGTSGDAQVISIYGAK